MGGSLRGLEVGLTRLSRTEQVPNQPRTEWERLHPTLGAVMSLAFTYRDAPLQPRLDLAARLPIAGGLAEAPPLAFRAAFGAAVPF